MKEYIQILTKNEKIVVFILTINLLINIIIYFISKNYQENQLSNTEFINYFYPFVELHSEYLRGKYENTKLVASYNLPEFIVYGLIPLGIFIIWLKLFKTDKKIKTMKKLLLIVLFVPFLGFSQEGFEYAITGNEIDYYVKIESDVDSNFGLYSKFWLKYDNPSKKIKLKNGKYSTKGGGYTLSYMTISCSSKSHKTYNIINYNKEGNVIGRDDIPTFDKPIVPGSVIEGIYKKVCKKE